MWPGPCVRVFTGNLFVEHMTSCPMMLPKESRYWTGSHMYGLPGDVMLLII